MSVSVAESVLLVHVSATLFMVGLIWFVQVVHYPLLAYVGIGEVAAYEQAHTRRTSWVVAPPMFLESLTAALLIWVRPMGVTDTQIITGLVLLAVIWFSTQFIQVPCHQRLCQAFDPGVHRRLVLTNWVRTLAWTLRGLLGVTMLDFGLRA